MEGTIASGGKADPWENAGINIVGPECCVPLGVKVENLKAITECVKEAFPGE